MRECPGFPIETREALRPRFRALDQLRDANRAFGEGGIPGAERIKRIALGLAERLDLRDGLRGVRGELDYDLGDDSALPCPPRACSQFFMYVTLASGESRPASSTFDVAAVVVSSGS
jgi:hypothetical protein